jgi:hypothetical protein
MNFTLPDFQNENEDSEIKISLKSSYDFLGVSDRNITFDQALMEAGEYQVFFTAKNVSANT